MSNKKYRLQNKNKKMHNEMKTKSKIENENPPYQRKWKQKMQWKNIQRKIIIIINEKMI
jgi:hypothetical protein